MKLKTTAENKPEIDTIKPMNREIFQGDSLLSLLFCIVIIPLTHELK